ncbi:putative splicing factor, arginine/serine-rich protein 8, partial [Toxoplasma gondii FOU]
MRLSLVHSSPEWCPSACVSFGLYVSPLLRTAPFFSLFSVFSLRLGDMSAVPPPASLDAPVESESPRSPRMCDGDTEGPEETASRRGEEREAGRSSGCLEQREEEGRKRLRDETEGQRRSENPGVKREENEEGEAKNLEKELEELRRCGASSRACKQRKSEHVGEEWIERNESATGRATEEGEATGSRVEPELKVEREADVEAEFVPPFNVPRDRVPHLPKTLKEHLVIERTAHFVRTEGSRMEFRLKLDPVVSSQLCFLSVDHQLNAYYTYLRQTGEALFLHAPELLPPRLVSFSSLVYTHLPSSVKKSQKEAIDVQAGQSPGDKGSAVSEKKTNKQKTAQGHACSAGSRGASPRRLKADGGDSVSPSEAAREREGEKPGRGTVGGEAPRQAQEERERHAAGENALFQFANEEKDGGVSLLMSYGSDDEDEEPLAATLPQESGARRKSQSEKQRSSSGNAKGENATASEEEKEGGRSSLESASKRRETRPQGSASSSSAREADAETPDSQHSPSPTENEESDTDEELDPLWQSGAKLRVAFVLERSKRKRLGASQGRARGAGDVQTPRPLHASDFAGEAGDSGARLWSSGGTEDAAVAEALEELPPLPWAKANAKLQFKDVESLILHQVGCWLLAKGDEEMVNFAQQMTTDDPRFFFLKRDTLAFCYFKYVLRCVCREKQKRTDTSQAPLQLRLHPVTRAFLARLRFEYHLAQKAQAPSDSSRSSDVLTQDAINENAAAAAAASAVRAAEAAAIEEARAAEALALRQQTLSSLCGEVGSVSLGPLEAPESLLGSSGVSVSDTAPGGMGDVESQPASLVAHEGTQSPSLSTEQP